MTRRMTGRPDYLKLAIAYRHDVGRNPRKQKGIPAKVGQIGDLLSVDRSRVRSRRASSPPEPPTRRTNPRYDSDKLDQLIELQLNVAVGAPTTDRQRVAMSDCTARGNIRVRREKGDAHLAIFAAAADSCDWSEGDWRRWCGDKQTSGLHAVGA